MKSIAQLSFFMLFFISITAFSQEQLTGIQERQHPRLLLFKEEEPQVKAAIQKNEVFKKIQDLLLEETDQIVGAALLQHKKIGKRLLSVSREALRRVFFLSWAYRSTGNKKYLQAAEEQLVTISGFEDWNPSHYLDVAEMTLAAAIGYDWLFNDLSAAAKAKIKTAILNYGIRTSLDNRYNSWLKRENNWNQVCNAGIAYGALAVYEEDPGLCSQIIKRAIQSVKIPMEQYGPDGAYPEGYGYWSYGTTYNVLLLDALERLTGTDHGLGAIPGFAKTADYFRQMIAPGGLPFNYADCGTGAELNGAMFWFAGWLKDPALCWNELRYINDGKNKKGIIKDRFLPTVLLWGRSLGTTGIATPRQLFWTGGGVSPVAVMRTSWTDPGALFLGFKAGTPSSNHAHMDEGSFVFEADGIRWAQDFGMQDYESLESKGLNIWDSRQNSQRWSVFRYTNFAHNTLTFDDSLQRVKGVAAITKHSGNPAFCFAQSDLSEVYAGQVRSVKRGVAIRDQAYALIQDEIETAGKPVKMQWRMVTSAAVEVKSPEEILLKKNGKTLLMQLHAEQPVTIKTWSTAPSNNYDAPNPGTTIVGFEVTLPPGSSKRFVVTLAPEKNRATVHPAITALKEWK